MAKKSGPRTYHNNLTNKSRYDVHFRTYFSYAQEFKQDPYGNYPPQVFDTLLQNIGHPGSRFFFFTSLANYHGPWASKIPSVLTANNILNNMEWQDDLHYEAKMQQILKLIHGFKLSEAASEYTYFKQSLEPLLKTNPNLYDLFDKTFQNGQIDYPKFMALVLSLEQDINTVKSEINDLAIHTRKWDEAYRNAFNRLKRLNLDEYNNYGSDELFNLAKRKEIDADAKRQVDFATSQIEQQLANGLIDLKTVLGETKADEAFMSKLKILGNQMLLNNQTEMSGQEVRNKLGTSLLQKEHILVFYQQLKRMANAYDTTVERLYSVLKESMAYCEMFPNSQPNVKKNNGATSYISSSNQKLIHDITHLLVTLVNNDTLALQQYEALQKKANKKNKLNPRQDKYGGQSSEQWSGLIKRRRELILQTINGMPKTDKRDAALSKLAALEIEDATIHLDGQAEERFDIRNKAHFTEYINTVKEALNMHKDSSLEKVIDKLETILKTSEAYDRQEIIKITSEHGGALDLARILPNAVTTVLDNNFREDSVHVGYITYSYDNNKAFKAIDKDTKEINKALEKTSKVMNKLRTNDIYKILSKDNTSHGRQSREYNVMSTLEASKKIDVKTAENLQKELNLNTLEEALPLLKNLFVLEQSDKFSTTFNSIENGFKGGSLGGDLEKQIDNINNMLLLGGITPIDANFLISAIMNAGPGMLGYNQKDKLETYLSSIASVCMFTSGAQSLENYTNEILNNCQNQSASTTKIHVFKLGTLTVPLSYILELMEQGLMRCFDLLEETWQLGGYAGNQVTIINPVNEANDKISTWYQVGDKDFYIGDWQATAEAGLPKVSLDMAILGSYLDVLDEIKEIMESSIIS